MWFCKNKVDQSVKPNTLLWNYIDFNVTLNWYTLDYGYGQNRTAFACVTKLSLVGDWILIAWNCLYFDSTSLMFFDSIYFIHVVFFILSFAPPFMINEDSLIRFWSGIVKVEYHLQSDLSLIECDFFFCFFLFLYFLHTASS